MLTEDANADLARRPPSPCIGVCTLDDDEYCIGCYRHVDEIARWSSMSPEAQWHIVRALPARADGGRTAISFKGKEMEVEEKIKQQISENPVLLYMKGSPDFPQCGFSAQSVQALKQCDAEFAYVNILEEPDIRSTLKEVSNWPTYPQLYINGELMGGCDIITEMYRSGELKSQVQSAGSKEAS